MVTGVLFEILTKICPPAAHTDHDTLAGFADETNVEFGRNIFTRLMEMVELDIWVIVIKLRFGGIREGGGQGYRWCWGARFWEAGRWR